MIIKELDKYFIKNDKIYRKKYFCEKSKKMFYEKELKIQKVKTYNYVYINGKLQNYDKIKLKLETLII